MKFLSYREWCVLVLGTIWMVISAYLFEYGSNGGVQVIGFSMVFALPIIVMLPEEFFRPSKWTWLKKEKH